MACQFRAESSRARFSAGDGIGGPGAFRGVSKFAMASGYQRGIQPMLADRGAEMRGAETRAVSVLLASSDYWCQNSAAYC